MSDANGDPGAGAASDPAGAVPASPTPEKARVIVDPTHPEAGNGGTVPPIETRFRKGKPGGPGRPRGAWPRAALARELAKGWEQDADAADDEERIGARAIELARRMADAALAGDIDTVRAVAEVINQVEGKPQEYVENTGALTVKRIDLEGAA